MGTTYIQTGHTVRVYDSAVETFDELPVGTYTIAFSPTAGFSLNRVTDLEIGVGKVYGAREAKVDKVMRAWHISPRNLGVMLSGDKGQGKSLFLRMLAARAIADGLPVVRVTEDYEGLADFIDTLGEALVIFDEFDKVFPTSDRPEDDCQAQFLSLFDGTSNVRRLYVITINEIHRASKYLVNRPGRFHYHLRFDYPGPEDVREYLLDQVPGITKSALDSAVTFTARVPLNYDHLRAIATEMRLDPDAPFGELISDLNLKSVEDPTYLLTAEFPDGRAFTDTVSFNLFSNPESDLHTTIWDPDGESIHITFHPRDVVVMTNGQMDVPAASIRVGPGEDKPARLALSLLAQPSYSYGAIA